MAKFFEYVENIENNKETMYCTTTDSVVPQGVLKKRNRLNARHSPAARSPVDDSGYLSGFPVRIARSHNEG